MLRNNLVGKLLLVIETYYCYGIIQILRINKYIINHTTAGRLGNQTITYNTLLIL